jgi:L-ascorbate metabolism protein UlaG (beta-lactamase superfamily)
MDITYLGHSSFRIKTKSATVVTDPFDPKKVGLKFAPQEADIVTVSHDHDDHNFTEKISGVKKIITGPGEYEISGISIIGFPSFHDGKDGTERGKNTIYVFEAEGLRLAHLGDLGHAISDETVSEMGTIDILMIPTGGIYTIGPKEAGGVVSKIDPYFILPMHHKVPGLALSQADKLEPVETFLKEVGLTVENMPKFSIKKEDIIEDQSTKVIVLQTKP